VRPPKAVDGGGLVSVLAWAGPLALYIASAYRDVTYWDTGELDTVPWILGIAHPPGFPLYTLLGWVFAHLVPFGSVAFRMSLLSAIAMSACAWMLYRIVADASSDPLAGLCASWLFAAGLTAWEHATRAEVHAVEMAAFAALLFSALRWYQKPSTPRLFACAIAFGLAVAIHPVALLALPGLLMLLISRLHQVDAAPLAAAALLALVIATIWYAYLPLRSGYVTSHRLDPAAAYGMAGDAFWNYDDPSSSEGFVRLVSAQSVDVSGALHGYARGEFLDGAVAWVRMVVRELTIPGVVLAVFGIVAAWQRQKTRTVAMLIASLGSAAFAFGFGDESDVGRYFLPSFFVLCAFAGMGLAVVRGAGRRTSALVVAVTLTSVAWLVVSQRAFFNQPHDDRARADVNDVLRRTPDDAILVASWVLAPPLAYAAYVERATGGRVVISAWYGETEPNLRRWIARGRPVYVIGRPLGSVPGFYLERLASRTELYRVAQAQK
jgi:hypothetical protein